MYDAEVAVSNLGITATIAELNILDGVTATTAELNILDGVTATAAELNALGGITATVTELNYTDGVTSAIQTQIDNIDTSGDAGPISTASGTSITQAIPAGVQEIKIVLDGVRRGTTGGIGLKLGVGGTLQSTGYDTATVSVLSSPFLQTSTTSMDFLNTGSTLTISGTVTLTRAKSGLNYWDMSLEGRGGGIRLLTSSGVLLSGELDTVALVASSFSAGEFYVRWK